MSKGKKIILILSNYPDLLIMGITTDDQISKTALNKVYDFTKICIDVADQCVEKYTTSTKMLRWMRKLWLYMLDVSGTKSQTILALNKCGNPHKYNSEIFLWNLCLQHTLP